MQHPLQTCRCLHTIRQALLGLVPLLVTLQTPLLRQASPLWSLIYASQPIEVSEELSHRPLADQSQEDRT